MSRSRLAAEAGGRIYSNSAAAGILLNSWAGNEKAEAFEERFSGRKAMSRGNYDACRWGYELGER